MELILQPDEAGVLHAVLTHYLSDLRMEIGRTEDYEARRELHHYEAVLQALVARLDEQQAPLTAAPAIPGSHRHPFVQRPGD